MRPAGETKNEMWHRLFKSRIRRVEEQLRLITNLSRKGNYDYTEEEAIEYFNHLEESLKKTKDYFFGNTRKFTLNQEQEDRLCQK